MKSVRPRDGSDEPPPGGGRNQEAGSATARQGRNQEADFHGHKRRNETHASATDPDARLYKKGKGKESKLCFMGHGLMENRHGLLVDACLTLADGHAERVAALHMIEPRADKAYDTQDFVNELRSMKVTPHVTRHANGRRSAIDGRTTRHAGYARAAQLVGDKDPRHHEFSVQLRACDAAKTGSKTGVGALVALCTALLKKTTRGGLVIVGEVNLSGSIETLHNPVAMVEIAVEKGATAILMPVACRRQLFDLSDDMATKVDIQFYSDARDALLKVISDVP
jgi:hypothetical protein